MTYRTGAFVTRSAPLRGLSCRVFQKRLRAVRCASNSAPVRVSNRSAGGQCGGRRTGGRSIRVAVLKVLARIPSIALTFPIW